jgi:hypothetical protein
VVRKWLLRFFGINSVSAGKDAPDKVSSRQQEKYRRNEDRDERRGHLYIMKGDKAPFNLSQIDSSHVRFRIMSAENTFRTFPRSCYWSLRQANAWRNEASFTIPIPNGLNSLRGVTSVAPVCGIFLYSREVKFQKTSPFYISGFVIGKSYRQRTNYSKRGKNH